MLAVDYIGQAKKLQAKHELQHATQRNTLESNYLSHFQTRQRAPESGRLKAHLEKT